MEKGYCQCGCGQPTPIISQTEKKRGFVKGEHRRFVSGHNARGSNHPGWKGGRYINSQGYVLIKTPGHPRVDVNGYVPEHILVMEKVLGRFILPTEAIHHFDGVRHHNEPGNLMLFKTNTMHLAYHRGQEAQAQ